MLDYKQANLWVNGLKKIGNRLRKSKLEYANCKQRNHKLAAGGLANASNGFRCEVGSEEEGQSGDSYAENRAEVWWCSGSASHSETRREKPATLTSSNHHGCHYRTNENWHASNSFFFISFWCALCVGFTLRPLRTH